MAMWAARVAAKIQKQALQRVGFDWPIEVIDAAKASLQFLAKRPHVFRMEMPDSRDHGKRRYRSEPRAMIWGDFCLSSMPCLMDSLSSTGNCSVTPEAYFTSMESAMLAPTEKGTMSFQSFSDIRRRANAASLLLGNQGQPATKHRPNGNAIDARTSEPTIAESPAVAVTMSRFLRFEFPGGGAHRLLRVVGKGLEALPVWLSFNTLHTLAAICAAP